MKTIRNSFTLLGLCLTLAGLSLSLISYVILQSTPLTALGFSTVILSGVSLALGKGQPKIPPEASAILLQSGVENVSAIVEELGLKAKAVYVPSSMTAGKPQALIPLHSNPHPPQLENIILPKRLIVKHGPDAEDLGLLVTTPGSAVAGMVTAKTDATEGDLETAVTLVLVGTINLADGIRVTKEEGLIRVEISNPRLEYRKMWVYESLGSPFASIVASVVAEVLDKPIAVEREEYSKGKCVITLKLTGRLP
ncbi:MAG: hypothetical protein NWF05_06630 [Candidatus Bathyarchaeota archaeon]|nr:hypothetical protein [Candidatus Bathyarchaeota archaeon]